MTLEKSKSECGDAMDSVEQASDALIAHIISTGARAEYDMAGSAMVMDGPHRGALVSATILLSAYRAEVERLREALARIAHPDPDDAAFYDYSVAEDIAIEALCDG